ncbi:adenine phosphoribosyltransferase [Luteimonas aestuarii]|uniref:Adenine phosphoribosyltransferase n=1 Tax=Luteimonas aestuarii TaxID=453837 RepID=A0A4V6PLN4_9GAMM|nr:adenine phosphoribosyltransferase [Luteimonas aestuarii]TDK24357.1 adenine phosphoribosyltransferase [Luteimonas aestuarii]
MADWTRLIRDIPDFPKPGIVFKDISPVLADAAAFADAVEAMAAPWRAAPPQAVLGVEARGFILGAAMAQALGCGFVPVRKPGKLPGPVLAQDYALEYGSDRLEVHVDALPAHSRVVVVDDVLATGGTLAAAVALAQRQGMAVAGAAVLVELSALAGRTRWMHPLPLLAAAAW